MSLFSNHKGEGPLERLNPLSQWRAFARISNTAAFRCGQDVFCTEASALTDYGRGV